MPRAILLGGLDEALDLPARCNRPGWMFKPSAARYCRGLDREVVKGE